MLHRGFRSVGMLTLALAAAVGVGHAQQTFSNNSSTATPSNFPTASAASPYPSTITVPNTVTGTVATIKIVLHSVVSSTSGTLNSLLATGLVLQAPSGTNMEIFGGAGDGSDGGSGVNYTTLTFQDGGILPPYGSPLPGSGNPVWEPNSQEASPHSYITIGTPNFFGAGNSFVNGNKKMGSVAANGGVFQGLTAAGTWKLYLEDFQGDPVSFASWDIVLTTNAAVGTTTTVSSNLNPSFTTSPNNSVTLTATVSSGGNGNPTGSVAFTDNGASIGCDSQALSNSGQNSVATCTHSFTSQGNRPIVAAYTPGSGFGQSTSPTFIQLVKFHATNPTTNQYCNTDSLFAPGIPGNQLIYPSYLEVPTLSNTVANVAVNLNGYQGPTGLGAAQFLLVAPGAQNLDFLSHVGFSASQGSVNGTIADNNPSAPINSAFPNSFLYEPTDAHNTTDTFGAAPSPNPQPPGTFNQAQPTTPSFTLAQAFNGATGGEWLLYLYDAGGSGSNVTLSGGWCLTFTLNTGNPSTTTITSNHNPARSGVAVTFTATVKDGSNNPITSGTVTFTENGSAPAGTVSGNNVVNVNGSGVATFITSSLLEGDHIILATFNSGSFNSSNQSVKQRIDNNSTITGSSPTLNTVSFCNTGLILIPAGSGGPFNIGEATPNPSNIFVTTLPGIPQTVGVTLKNYFTSSTQSNYISSLLVGPGGANANTLSFFSQTGASNTILAQGDYIFKDSAAGLVPQSAFGPGSYKPTSYNNGTGSDTYFSSGDGFYTLPAGPYQFPATRGAFTFTNTYGAADGNGTWSLYFNQFIHADNSGPTNGWCVNFTETPPTLTAVKGPNGLHVVQGDTGDSITVAVSNQAGPGSAGGAIPLVVTDVFPAGLTPTGGSGTSWTCGAPSGQTISCSSTEFIAPGNSFDPLTINFNVSPTATAPATVNNKATLTGSAITTGVDSNTLVITVDPAPDVTVSVSHTDTFTQGSTATLKVTAHNIIAGSKTRGTTTVVATLPNTPSNWTLNTASSAGNVWTCGALNNVVTCTDHEQISGVGDYTELDLLVNIPANSAVNVSASATISGGGELASYTGNDTSAPDNITVVQVPASIVVTNPPNATQSALINTAFNSLAVTVKDAGNVVIPSYSSAIFTAVAGGSGQSGTFPGPSSTATITTDGSGVANPGTFTANGIAGAYTVDVAAGPAPHATFNLTNTAPDLTAVKTDNVGNAALLGGNWTWKVHLANSGTGPANFANAATILTDHLPSANIDYGAASTSSPVGIGGGSISCAIASNTLTCTANGAVSIAAPGSIDVSFLATPTAIGTYANPTGGVCAVNPGHVPVESDFTNNGCSDTVTVRAPDLTAVKTDNVGGATFLGTPWTWNIHLANGGNGTATFTTGQTILTDNLPTANIGYGSVTTTPAGGVTGPILCSITTSVLTCTANGGTVTIPQAATVDVSFLATPTAIGFFTNPPPPDSTADVVYGQLGSFTTAFANNGGISANSLDNPAGVASDSNGNLYVADANGQRVLYYPAGSTTATRVYGQGGSFSTNTANKGGISADSLSSPRRVAVDSSGNLYVADNQNNRVLYYTAGSTTATRVYGQGGSFTTNTANNGGISADSLNSPIGVALDNSGNLYVADNTNSRVLYYPAGSTTATRVYGQGGSFTTANSNNGGISPDSLSLANSVAVDSTGNLYVSDFGNNRLLYFPAASTTATRVYGQGGSFTTGTVNNGGISASSLDNPQGVALDSSGSLYVADVLNSRVLYYPAGSTTATVVYGQGGNFTTNTANNGGVSANSLNLPVSAGIDPSGNLYVADLANSRVLKFNGNPCLVDPGRVVTESNEGNNTCGDTVTVTAPDLTAVKTNNVSGAITLGGNWTWSIHVANVGNAPANFATAQSILTDNLPSTNIGYGTASMSNPAGITGTFTCTITSNVLACPATGGSASLAAGGSFDVSFVATPTGGTSFANPTGGVCAADPANVVAESNEANNSCSDTVTVSAPDLTALKTDTVSNATTLGTPWTWKVHVANTGTAVANFAMNATILTDTLPSTGINYGSANISGAGGIGGTVNCSITANVLTCSAGTAVTVAANTGAFDVSFTATPTAIGTFANPTGGACMVDPNNVVTESNKSNNSCSDTVTVTAPDLTATKSNNVSGNGTSGVPWTWKVHLANIGNAVATFASGQTILTDFLPSTNIVYGSPSTSGASGVTGPMLCTISSNILSCMANGDPVTIAATTGVVDVSFTATASVAGSYANPTGGVCAVDPLGVVTESNESNNSCSDTVNVNSADLTAVKTNNVSGTVNLGTGWTWKVHVGNIGSAAANFANGSTILTDNLPSTNITYGTASMANASGIAGTVNCSISSNTLSCTAGTAVTIAATTGGFDVSFPVNAPTATGSYVNPTGGVCAVDPGNVVVESNKSNNSCSDTVTVTSVDLTAVKTDNVGNATTLGTPWTWKIHVANSGTTGANFANGNTVLTDNLPSTNIGYGSASMSNAAGITGTINCAIASNTLTCSSSGASSIGAGGSFDVSFTATPTAIGTFANPTGGACAVDPSNVVAESNKSNNACSDTVTVTAPDLTAVKTDTVSNATTLGTPWTWKVHVANIGNAAASFANGATILTDFLPSAGIGYGSASMSGAVGIGGTVNCSITSNVLTCTAGTAVTIAATTGVFDVSFTATPTAIGSFANPTGGVCAVDPLNVVTESSKSNNSCSDTVVVTAPDLTAVKSNNVSGNGASGVPWTWKVHLANIGNAPATFSTGAIVLTDNLPSTNIAYGSASTSNASGITGGTISCVIATNTLTCTAVGTTLIAAAGSIDVSFSATASVAGSYANPTGGVCTVDPNNVITESNENNNSCSDTVNVNSADLTAVKTDNVGGTVNLGTGWTWKVHVGNIGSVAANFANGSTILTDNLPSTNITYGTASMANASGIAGTVNCSISSNTLSCTAGTAVTIAATTGGFDVSFPVNAPTATGSYVNPTGGVCAVDPGNVVVESNKSNNSCSDTVTVTSVDLTAVKTDNVSNATTLGTPWTWKIHVANSGTTGANFANGNTVLTDNLPSTNIGYGSASMSNASLITGTINCAIASNILTCSSSGASSIGAGGSFDVSFTATPTAIGTFANPTGGACAVDPSNVVAESNKSNNACSDTVTVTAPDLTAVKSNNVSGVGIQGSPWTWKIHLANSGNAAANFANGATILTDNLPSTGIGYGSASMSGAVGIGGTVNCSITSNVLTCTAGTAVTIAATTGAFDVSFTATPTAIGSFANPTAGVCAVDPGNVVTESSKSNNSCSDTVVVTAPDLTAVKSNNVGGNGTAGIPWTWKIHLANAGNAPANFSSGNTILTDNLPSTNIVYGSPSVSNASGFTGGINGCAIVSNVLTCTAVGNSSFAVGGSFDVSFTATASVAASYANPTSGVCQIDPSNVVTESNENNNSCSDTVVVGVADLTAVKSDNVGGTITPGNNWTWKIHVANIGGGAANFANGNTILTDNLPSTNITYGAASMANATGIAGTVNCAIASNTLTCTAGSAVAIAPSTGGFDVSFTATPSASSGSFVNPTGGVCAVDPGNVVVESNKNNNSCSDTVIVSASQTINFPPIPDHTFGDAPFTISATASSGLTVSFNSQTLPVCTVSGNTVTIVHGGTCTIQATQAGNGSYQPATPVSRSFQVMPAASVITWANPADILYGGSLGSGQLNATANTAGTLVYTPPAGTVLPLGDGQTLRVDFTPSDTGNYNSSFKTVTINVKPPGGSPVNLVVTTVLSRDSNTQEVLVKITVANSGGTGANAVQLTSVSVGGTPTTTPLPASLGTIAVAGQASTTVRLPASVGSPGARVVLSIAGSYGGGSFGGNIRATLP